jgi:hypothetical protein
MFVKGIIDEDFVNYKKPAMVIEFPYCDFKCDKECGKPICQNNPLTKIRNIKVEEGYIIEKYLKNPITEAIICQGLEPLDTMVMLFLFIKKFREFSDDDLIIYTGYNKEEERPQLLIKFIKENQYKNIIIKYGRYIPNQTPHYDKVLGVNLASDNQYAERL